VCVSTAIGAACDDGNSPGCAYNAFCNGTAENRAHNNGTGSKVCEQQVPLGSACSCRDACESGTSCDSSSMTCQRSFPANFGAVTTGQRPFADETTIRCHGTNNGGSPDSEGSSSVPYFIAIFACASGYFDPTTKLCEAMPPVSDGGACFANGTCPSTKGECDCNYATGVSRCLTEEQKVREYVDIYGHCKSSALLFVNCFDKNRVSGQPSNVARAACAAELKSYDCCLYSTLYAQPGACGDVSGLNCSAASTGRQHVCRKFARGVCSRGNNVGPVDCTCSKLNRSPACLHNQCRAAAFRFCLLLPPTRRPDQQIATEILLLRSLGFLGP
jgi:hypothetical protein